MTKWTQNPTLNTKKLEQYETQDASAAFKSPQSAHAPQGSGLSRMIEAYASEGRYARLKRMRAKLVELEPYRKKETQFRDPAEGKGPNVGRLLGVYTVICAASGILTWVGGTDFSAGHRIFIGMTYLSTQIYANIVNHTFMRYSTAALAQWFEADFMRMVIAVTAGVGTTALLLTGAVRLLKRLYYSGARKKEQARVQKAQQKLQEHQKRSAELYERCQSAYRDFSDLAQKADLPDKWRDTDKMEAILLEMLIGGAQSPQQAVEQGAGGKTLYAPEKLYAAWRTLALASGRGRAYSRLAERLESGDGVRRDETDALAAVLMAAQSMSEGDPIEESAPIEKERLERWARMYTDEKSMFFLFKSRVLARVLSEAQTNPSRLAAAQKKLPEYRKNSVAASLSDDARLRDLFASFCR